MQWLNGEAPGKQSGGSWFKPRIIEALLIDGLSRNVLLAYGYNVLRMGH